MGLCCLCISGFGWMRVCLAVGMILLGGFLSSDLAVISWAMSIECVVTVGPLGSCLCLLFLRQLRFALGLCLCGVGESFVLYCVDVWG